MPKGRIYINSFEGQRFALMQNDDGKYQIFWAEPGRNLREEGRIPSFLTRALRKANPRSFDQAKTLLDRLTEQFPEETPEKERG